MKKSLILLGLCIMSFLACKRDKDPVPTTPKFEDITRADIVAKAAEINLETLAFDANSATGLKVGSTVFFKTSVMGNYGKLKVLSLNEAKQLVLHVVIYAENGTVIANKADFSPEYSASKVYNLDIVDFPEGDPDLSDFNFSFANGFASLNWLNNSRVFIYAN